METAGRGERTFAPPSLWGLGSSIFVGRDAELQLLRSALGDALGGHGRLVLLAGEPGIGKSRLADEIAGEARDQGGAVLWGRCWEAGGAPAYWPWVQSLRALVRALTPERLRSDLGGGAAEVAELVPELRQVLPDLPATPAANPETARFRLFDAVSAFLRSAGETQPLVLVLDDVHAADTPSLLLLQFLAGELPDARMLVLAAYRDTELTEDHPLTTALAALDRHPVTRLPLGGLSEREVSQLIELTTRDAPGTNLVTAVQEKAEGNPLFIGEVVRLLAGEELLERPPGLWQLAVPQGIRQVIARRLSRLAEETNDVLALAAVLGREFDVEALQGLTGLPREDLLERLDEALAARIVVEVPSGVGRLRFSHALIRDTLYDELSVARRVRMHREAGEALERRYADVIEPHLAELTHHFTRAAPAGEPRKAVDYASRAGDRAVRVVAYEEAVRLFDLALQTLELQPVVDPERRCELLLLLGDAQGRAGDGPGSKESFLSAASAARRIGDSDLFARAALGYGGRFLWARAGSDPHLVPLLEEALVQLDGQESPLKARVMSRLAGALRDGHDRKRPDELSAAAVELARRLSDPETLAYALDARCFAIFWPENPEQRLVLAEELIGVAEECGDRERAQHAGFVGRVGIPLELGDLETVRSELGSVNRLAQDLRQPAQLWLMTATRATVALFEGRFDEAEELIEKSLRLGERVQASDARLSHTVQRFTLSLLTGGLETVEEGIRRSIVDYPARPMFRCMLALLLLELNRDDEAHAAFDELAGNGFSALPRTNEWLFSLGFLADVAHGLGNAAQANVLYELLLTHSARNACTPDYIAIGSVARSIGVAAATASRWSEAERHFEEAFRANTRMGARPWAARTTCDWADMLLRRDGPGDRERALDLAVQAAVVARELGMEPLVRRARKLGAAPPPGASEVGPKNVVPARPCIFRREGEYRSVAYEGDAFRLKESKGLTYLARLLTSPGQEIHALELVSETRGVAPRSARRAEPSLEGAPFADTGEILDARAKEEYRRRLTELDDELAEARDFADPERVARVEQEREFLLRELAGAIGLGGRRRREGSSAERARVSVTRAIRAAMARITEHSPALGEHLERTIRTGTFCSYDPDPGALPDWQLR
jgi:eukaryotic-like serine/threonine-protein kinase